MTEKRDLNNELILMKKTIQTAKVCVIRKLVRKLRDISNPRRKEVTGLALIGKRRRLTDQINYLKKTSNSQLASLALTFDKNPSKILTNQLSSIEDASLANIVTFKTVLDKVNQIKSKFSLDENEQDWREKVREIGKKKKKKIEKETNRSRNKERKETLKKHKDLVKKRDEWLEENIETTEETVQSFESEDDECQESSDKSAKKTKKSVTLIDSDTKMKALPKKKPIFEPKKIVDSFFITGTGESYLATKVIDRIQPSGPNDGLDRKERRAQQFGNKPKTNTKRFDVPASSKSNKLMKSVTNVEDLHPSWAAKMKAKGIDKFQGKKTKFDDEKTVSVVVKTKIAESQNDSEKIHPSWAAKQKVKPVISEFKGNKIVFDD